MSACECPYCEHEQEVCQDDNHACDPAVRYEEECQKCGKTFELRVDWTPYFYTDVI